MKDHEQETKEKENTIRQYAEYWQTNSKKTTCTGNEHLPRMMKTTVTNTRLWERKSNGNQPPTEGRNERMNITYIYIYTL